MKELILNPYFSIALTSMLLIHGLIAHNYLASVAWLCLLLREINEVISYKISENEISENETQEDK